MAQLSKELASLDFANLIGGPLNAIVDAQARSAIATANFVQEVGFDKDGQVKNSTFRYSKPNEDGEQEEFALTVPFIMMLPVPFVKIEEGEIEFNAKLTSTQEKESSSELSGNTTTNTRAGYWFVRANVKASASYKKTTSATEKVERTYEMKIRVKVKGTELPMGMERVFGMLESSMEDVPTGKLTGTLTLLEEVIANDTIINLPAGLTMKVNDIITFAAHRDSSDNDVVEDEVKVTACTAADSSANPAVLASVTVESVKTPGSGITAIQTRGTTATWRRNKW